MRLPAALLAVLLLASCTGGGEGDAAPSATPTPTASSTVAAAPNASATASPSQQAATDDAASVVVDVIPKGFEGGFTSPSGNISCDLQSGCVTCFVRNAPWKQIPQKQGCAPGQQETLVSLNTNSSAQLSGQCYRPNGGAVLAYGRGVQSGTLRCAMLRQGVECLVVGTELGFSASRSAHRLTAAGSRLGRARVAPHSGSMLVAPAGFSGNLGTPSKNIACRISDTSATCYSSAPPWDTQVGDCEDYGDPVTLITVTDSQQGALIGDCWSDFPFYNELPLSYGTSLRVGRMQCDSAKTGLTCTNRETRHGFFVSKASHRVF